MSRCPRGRMNCRLRHHPTSRMQPHPRQQGQCLRIRPIDRPNAKRPPSLCPSYPNRVENLNSTYLFPHAVGISRTDSGHNRDFTTQIDPGQVASIRPTCRVASICRRQLQRSWNLNHGSRDDKSLTARTAAGRRPACSRPYRSQPTPARAPPARDEAAPLDGECRLDRLSILELPPPMSVAAYILAIAAGRPQRARSRHRRLGGRSGFPVLWGAVSSAVHPRPAPSTAANSGVICPPVQPRPGGVAPHPNPSPSWPDLPNSAVAS